MDQERTLHLESTAMVGAEFMSDSQSHALTIGQFFLKYPISLQPRTSYYLLAFKSLVSKLILTECKPAICHPTPKHVSKLDIYILYIFWLLHNFHL